MRGEGGRAVRVRTRQEWPKACVVGCWPMSGGLSDVAARSDEGGGAALSLSSC